jgi:hypothetical protein
MDERLIRVVDAMATSFQWLTIAAVLLAGTAIWALICRADRDRCEARWWRQKELRESAREERGFE